MNKLTFIFQYSSTVMASFQSIWMHLAKCNFDANLWGDAEEMILLIKYITEWPTAHDLCLLVYDNIAVWQTWSLEYTEWSCALIGQRNFLELTIWQGTWHLARVVLWQRKKSLKFSLYFFIFFLYISDTFIVHNWAKPCLQEDTASKCVLTWPGDAGILCQSRSIQWESCHDIYLGMQN